MARYARSVEKLPCTNFECFFKNIKKENIMKKALVILLALTMVMSMMAIAPIGVAAEDEIAVGSVAADYKPEGTAIKTAEEFAAMDPAGTYYLANDITIDATYASSFTGTFDGNGKTITTSVPLFVALDGNVKNLTIGGNIVITVEPTEHKAEGWAGALANIAGQYAPVTITNVVNKAPLTSTVAGLAGFVGMAMNDTSNAVTFTNCVNYGGIVCGVDSTGKDCGGFVGQYDGAGNDAEQRLKFIDCVNYGTINACGRPGGIIGYANSSTYFEGCVNNGVIQSTHNYCGGIVGRASTDAGTGHVYTFIDCTNNGDVDVYSSQGAGFVGYSGGVKAYEFKNCVNNGDVYPNKNVAATNNIDLAGFVGNFRQNEKNSHFTDTIYFENCVNNGTIGVKDLYGGQDGNSRYSAGFINKPRVITSLTMINCINNGDIYANNVYLGGSNAAGLVTYVLFKNKTNEGATFTNCINNGEVLSTGQAGGITSSIGTGNQYGNARFTACGNTGKITSDTNYAGGVASYAYGTQYEGADFKYCFNTGDIHSGTSYAGGIIAYSNDYSVDTNIQYCYSAGKVTSDKAAKADFGTGVVDGAVAAISMYTYTNSLGNTKYFYAPADGKVTIANDVVTFTANAAYNYTNENVVNGETLEGAKRYGYTDTLGNKWVFMTSSAVSGVVAITENAGAAPTIVCGGYTLHVMPWNVTANTTVELMQFDTNPSATALMWNNKGQSDFSNHNYILEGIATSAYVCGVGASWGAMQSDVGVTYVDEAAFTSGEIAHLLNEAIGEVVFYQNLNEKLFTVDTYPTTDATHAKVVKQGNVYGNLLFEENADVTPPTGDATVYVVIALAVSTVSLAALAVVKKRKEN